jgi:hypothetical protein
MVVGRGRQGLNRSEGAVRLSHVKKAAGVEQRGEASIGEDLDRRNHNLRFPSFSQPLETARSRKSF